MNRNALRISGLVLLATAAGVMTGCAKQPEVTINNDGCLHYASQVTLNGLAQRQEVTAPGKMTRVALMLNLDKPVCVSPASSASAATYKRIDDLKQIELVAQSDITAMHQLSGFRVIAKGSLTNISGDGTISPVGLTVIHIKPEGQ